MARAWKIALLILAFLLLAAIGWSQTTPSFNTKDRQAIEKYYDKIIGTLAPGSLDRSPFPLGVEKALVRGSHVPMQLEKDLEPLPPKLESELSQLTAGYARYKLGRHVLLVKKSDLEISDILKNVAVKERSQ